VDAPVAPDARARGAGRGRAGLALFEVAPQMARAKFRIDSGVHTMGAPLLGRDLGWSDQTSQVLKRGRAGGRRFRLNAGAVHDRPGVTRRAARTHAGGAGRDPAARLFHGWGELRVSLDLYLLDGALGLAPGGPGTGTRRETRTAQVACALLMFALWSDGALCVFFNRIVPLLPTQFAGIDAPWRLITQPLHWALMMLFAGWLLEGVLATARQWWDARKET